jgi:hypothetical protein
MCDADWEQHHWGGYHSHPSDMWNRSGTFIDRGTPSKAPISQWKAERTASKHAGEESRGCAELDPLELVCVR